MDTTRLAVTEAHDTADLSESVDGTKGSNRAGAMSSVLSSRKKMLMVLPPVPVKLELSIRPIHRSNINLPRPLYRIVTRNIVNKSKPVHIWRYCKNDTIAKYQGVIHYDYRRFFIKFPNKLYSFPPRYFMCFPAKELFDLDVDVVMVLLSQLSSNGEAAINKAASIVSSSENTPETSAAGSMERCLLSEPVRIAGSTVTLV
jgi:hypothetical protein